MRYLRYLALLSVLVVPSAFAHAGVGVAVGFGPGYVGPAPVCAYGYYGYYPYACAPYGFYGPRWFSGGVFIGAGPWFRGYGRGFYGPGFYRPGFYRPGFNGRGFYGRGFYGRAAFAPGRGGFGNRGGFARASVGGGFRGGMAGGGFHGGGRR
jgi:hypothetical protein